VYPGVGWIIWRSKEALPEELVFKVDYLGGEMPTFALNFSRPGAQVVAQYFNFLRLGLDGYRQVQQGCRHTAMWLAEEIAKLGPYQLMSKGDELPVFAFRTRKSAPFSVYDVSHALRAYGWLVPAYPMPEGMEDVSVLRVVVRNGFSHDLATMLLADLGRVTEYLTEHPPPPAGSAEIAVAAETAAAAAAGGSDKHGKHSGGHGSHRGHTAKARTGFHH
jgi:glutamate decarboxylase